MSIKVLVEQEGKKVSLEGEMDLLLAENLGNEKKYQLQPEFSLDLSHVTFTDSSGINILLEWLLELQQQQIYASSCLLGEDTFRLLFDMGLIVLVDGRIFLAPEGLQRPIALSFLHTFAEEKGKRQSLSKDLLVNT
ncbi:hypothetical protein SAMN02745885_00535 [Carboxydocella sporoproducens DSM 16521]|uniref:STAS domain-containing protein n=2 Tax=Carboxydocella TaxID=178898 RepID=A0A1T4MEN3_9FIRM|nr:MULTISPECIES: hypothetical protein [Carboxydocella]AVX21291.1 hypothetical protein CFE_2128 [Carboxydocella thermautotrophica]AVX31723.1 hypothetical protein CTH_2161 [Carboxydocella thermautotrophica]GAW29337.1 hypothetical protein ULO1_19070 [Carboxydocella sp. ULO1]SJZ65351.1 hypothetical protein SAMN02745885_00535 [Carboxydocella sporoproducens DSM 16521]